MVSKKSKPYAAFLSFADPDRELVRYLSSLFSQFGKKTYFAPREIPRSGTPEWRRQIIKGIRASASFIPIYTRHSLTRAWVLYESGLADAQRLPRFPARVSCISPSDIKDLPGPGAFVYELFDKNSLADLIVNVCVCHGDDKEIITPKAHNLVQSSPLADKINELSKTRWIFVAGNYPENAALPNSGIEWFTTREEYLTRLQKFVKELTVELLEGGFSVAACPQVNAIGIHVVSKALAWLGAAGHPPHVDFAIGGIHPIDREARTSSLSETAKRKWLDHIMDFRRSYLADKEWLILIGGNEGTMEEYLAANDARVKVLPIPCFGGSSAAVYSESNIYREIPCEKCQNRNGQCTQEDIKRIVGVLKGQYA